VDKREQERMRLTREVGKLLLRRGFREMLVPLRKDGTRPFVVGLPDDTIRELAGRVARVGGAAHLIVMSPSSTPGSDRVQVLRVSECEAKPVAELDESCEAPVGEDSTLGMLMEIIKIDQELCFYIYDRETVVKFLSDTVLPVPA
jgi:hypothetical protein